MKAIIKPSKARGKISAPPSKSMAHRMLICAGLSKGTSKISGVAFSQDVLATLDCLKALGASYTVDDDDTVTITGVNPTGYSGNRILNCRECGSTLRFMIPLCMTSSSQVSLSGSEVLMSRPLDVYKEIAQNQNLGFEMKNKLLTVKGSLKPGNYEITGSVSSQFVSGLLFSLPLLQGDSHLKLIPPVESRPYIDMTLDALSHFGIEVISETENSFFIKGNQSYKSVNVTVEGDYSNAAFLEALNITGGSVELTGLNKNSLQGDKVYRDIYQCIKDGCPETDISNCPDLGPVLFTVAAVCGGGTFTGTKRLKWKESDRVGAMAQELSKCGVLMTIEENRVQVHKSTLKPPSLVLSGHNDHRIVMSLAVLLTMLGGEIEGCEAVRKSYPDFFDKLKELGVEVELYGMDK